MLNYLRLAYYRKFKPDVVRTAFHEAGHGIVAALFDHKLALKELTINKKALRSKGKNFNGALHIEFHTIPQSTDYEAGDYLTLIAVAGTCAQTLYTHGLAYVVRHQNNLGFAFNRDLLDRTGAQVDWDMAFSESGRTEGFIRVKANVIVNSAVRWVFDYLMKDEVWRATQKLAEEIILHPNSSLTQNEIPSFLKKIGFNTFLNQERNAILSTRYPLSKSKIIF